MNYHSVIWLFIEDLEEECGLNTATKFYRR